MVWLADRLAHRHRGDADRCRGSRLRAPPRSATGCSPRAAPRGSTIPNLARVVECGVHEHWPYVAVDRRAGVTLDEWLAEHPKPTTDEAALLDRRGAARPGLRPRRRRRPSRPAAPHHARQRARPGRASWRSSVGARRARSMPRPRRDNDRAMRAGPVDAARAAQRRRARRARLRRAAAPPARRRAGARQRRHRPGDRAPGAARPRARAPAVDHAASDPRAAARDRQSQHRRRRCACATATRAPSSARINGWREALADDDGGPVALLLDRLRTVGHLPALPGLGDAGAAGHGDREPAHRRDRARTCCPTWRCRSSCCARSTSAQRAGHADRRQRPGADPAPRRRADRRRRRAPGGQQPARLAGSARRRRRHGAARRRSTGSGSPAMSPRRCVRRATTPRSSTCGGAAEPRPAAAALPLRRGSRADPPAEHAVRRRRSDGDGPRAARPRRGRGERTRCSASTSRPSASRSRATGAWATRSCT